MSKTVLIDSNIFIWGIKGQSTDGQEGMIQKAKDLIEYLTGQGYKLMLPVPQMVELMSHVPVAEQDQIRLYFDSKFMVVPFDEIAGIKCAELLHLSLQDEEIKKLREEGKIPKNKIKYDCMLCAIAIVRGATKIYSEDDDMRRFAHGQIEVNKMPTFARAKNLFNEEMNLVEVKQDEGTAKVLDKIQKASETLKEMKKEK